MNRSGSLRVQSSSKRWQWGLHACVIIHTILPSCRVILWIELGGKSKWLPFSFGYHDVMHTASIDFVRKGGGWDPVCLKNERLEQYTQLHKCCSQGLRICKKYSQRYPMQRSRYQANCSAECERERKLKRKCFWRSLNLRQRTERNRKQEQTSRKWKVTQNRKCFEIWFTIRTKAMIH